MYAWHICFYPSIITCWCSVPVDVNYGNGRAVTTARDQEKVTAKESEGTRNQFAEQSALTFLYLVAVISQLFEQSVNYDLY